MNKNLINAALKFIVVGGISTALNYLVFYLLLKFAITNYIIASVIGYICGLALGFYLNNAWTFEYSGYNWKMIAGYCLVYMVSLGFSILFLWIAVQKHHLNKYFMNFVAICISTALNFFGLNSLIYNKNESKETGKNLG